MSVCGLGPLVSTLVAVQVCAIAAIAVGIVLVVLGDPHGVALLLGAALGILFALLRRDRARRMRGVRSPA
jgi:drug/metabolite transporter (DMT)-like permease